MHDPFFWDNCSLSIIPKYAGYERSRIPASTKPGAAPTFFSVFLSTSNIGIYRVAGRVTRRSGFFVFPWISLTLCPALPVTWWRAHFAVLAKFPRTSPRVITPCPVKGFLVMGHHHESVDHLDRFVTFSVCVPGAGTERTGMLPSPALFLHFISRQAVPDYLTIPGIVSLLNGGANTLTLLSPNHSSLRTSF